MRLGTYYRRDMQQRMGAAHCTPPAAAASPTVFRPERSRLGSLPSDVRSDKDTELDAGNVKDSAYRFPLQTRPQAVGRLTVNALPCEPWWSTGLQNPMNCAPRRFDRHSRALRNLSSSDGEILAVSDAEGKSRSLTDATKDESADRRSVFIFSCKP